MTDNRPQHRDAEFWQPASGEPLHSRVHAIVGFAAMYPPCRVCDVAAGNCAIPLQLETLGHSVTAFDITDCRVSDKARRMFIQKSALQIDYSQFDLIVCAGLLYHLPLAQQVQIVAAWGSRPVILDTHVTTKAARSQGRFRGLPRKPTTSSKAGMCFVHTVGSLFGELMSAWSVCSGCQTTADRFTWHLKPLEAA